MSHSEDIASHIASVHEDLEYWRTKRLEPRILRLIRKGEVSFQDLAEAAGQVAKQGTLKQAGDLPERVEAAELQLGEYVRKINIFTTIIGQRVLVEESRDEAGVYDEGLRLRHTELTGTQEERMSQLETLLQANLSTVSIALRALAVRGIIAADKLEEMLAAEVLPSYENGARIVARAWTDPAFKAQLLRDGKRTLRELGFGLSRTPKLVVVEDTPDVHNVIVCTLCSCYPYELLGNPPWWYKQDSYKQTIVKSPRETLSQMFNLKIPEGVEVRVYDSTSDIRYMVLPERPSGSEAMSEEELSGLVTEESLIGVGSLRARGGRDA